MPRKQNPDPLSAAQQQEMVSEGMENFELPKSVVMKIAKSALPDDTRLTKDTVLSLVKGSTVFINYLAATAHDVAVAKQHKSIAASDVLRALELLDFGDMVDPLQKELSQYKDTGKPSHRKNSSAANGSKGLSISIPPAASISAPAGDGTGKKIIIPSKDSKKVAGTSASVAGKGLTVVNGKSAVETAVKGKGKAVDGDGDAVMGGDDEPLVGDMVDEDAVDDEEDEQEVDEEDEEDDDEAEDEEVDGDEDDERRVRDEEEPPVSPSVTSS